MMSGIFLWNLLTQAYSPSATYSGPQPHIVLLVADDLGWNDVGWHNPAMLTPNLDRLAYSGVILNSSYVQPVCSPSRSSYLTGYYPFKMGMQHGRIVRNKPHGVPVKFRMLPEDLKEHGYSTHLVGKWHLGFCKWGYTPTSRGFDTFYGFYSGSRDYYTHKAGKEKGFDFRYNKKPIKHRGIHSSKLFTKRAVRIINHHNSSTPLFLNMAFQLPHSPLQVPKEYTNLYSDIRSLRRRRYSGMVSLMDESVGKIVSALTANNMIDNTVIVFLSDNGGAPYEGGNNWPLRGAKGTLWEGGVRTPAFVWGPMLKKTGYVSHEMIHAVDWYPTLLSLAGGYPGSRVDGVNQLDMLMKAGRSARNEFVYNINEVNGRSALRNGPYKLILGNAGPYNEWYPAPTWWDTPWDARRWKSLASTPGRRHTKDTMLFNLIDDPQEMFNLANKKPMMVKKLKAKLRQYRKELVPAFNPRKVRKANPKFWNGFWSPGWC